MVCVYLGTLNIRRAAAFWISCRGLTADAGKVSQQGVAVVQAGQDRCLDEELSGVGCEERTDSPDVVQEEPACPGHRCVHFPGLWGGEMSSDEEQRLHCPCLMERGWEP